MTFRVEIVHDLTYTCPTGHTTTDHPTDLDDRTWTCRTCRQSVHVDMDDHKGHTYTVERVPAREIRRGDFIVYRTRAGLACNQVTGSNEYQGKGLLWYLAVAQFGYDTIPPTQYVSRIPG